MERALPREIIIQAAVELRAVQSQTGRTKSSSAVLAELKSKIVQVAGGRLAECGTAVAVLEAAVSRMLEVSAGKPQQQSAAFELVDLRARVDALIALLDQSAQYQGELTQQQLSERFEVLRAESIRLMQQLAAASVLRGELDGWQTLFAAESRQLAAFAKA